MYSNETKIKVRYAETDQMGIVHHSNYYAWFEVGRTEFFGETGLSYKDIEKRGILFPLIESYCQYKVGAVYEDELTIKTWIKQLSGAKVTFCYKVIRDNDSILIAEGKTLHAFVTKSFKPVNLKKWDADLYERLEELSMYGA